MSVPHTGTGDRLLGGILSTDFYQLTMAQLYFRAGLADRPARFEHFFRSYPDYGRHQAGYCVAAGMAPFAKWMTGAHPTDADLEALRGHRSSTGQALFGDDFLGWFADLDFSALTLRCPRVVWFTPTRRSPWWRARWPPPNCWRPRC